MASLELNTDGCRGQQKNRRDRKKNIFGLKPKHQELTQVFVLLVIQSELAIARP